MAEIELQSENQNNATVITLGVLNAISENEAVTQRSVAQDLGIALGLANAYLKRCVRKGFVKVTQAPRNRYAYYLTPRGLVEKGRLTAEFLSSSLGFFRKARQQLGECLLSCQRRGADRIVLVGVSELAEVAAICAIEYSVPLQGIVDPAFNRHRFCGLPVAAKLSDFESVDVALITAVNDTEAVYETLLGQLPDERILTPGFLKIVRQKTKMPPKA
jgi:DNA-binding MarR family transcriptional regulator